MNNGICTGGSDGGSCVYDACLLILLENVMGTPLVGVKVAVGDVGRDPNVLLPLMQIGWKVI